MDVFFKVGFVVTVPFPYYELGSLTVPLSSHTSDSAPCTCFSPNLRSLFCSESKIAVLSGHLVWIVILDSILKVVSERASWLIIGQYRMALEVEDPLLVETCSETSSQMSRRRCFHSPVKSIKEMFVK